MKKFFTKYVQHEILKSSIVSFDIFDTLLLRPYVNPKDLFLHMAKYYNEPFFYDFRISAENAARKNSKAPDITLDDIYNQIQSEFKNFKEKEKKWEHMVLRANPEMLEVFDFALKNNKQIIIASDMYLPSDFIADVLHKNGFKGYKKLYVSGEKGVVKHDGSMFDLIIKETKTSPNKILHIGDNYNSDYKVPRKYGIHTIRYTPPTESFIKDNIRINNFLNTNKGDLGASILVSILAYQNLSNKNDNYWYNLGYQYTGPVTYGYTRFIEKEAKEHNVNNLMFVARDGYTLQRVFNTFNNSIYNSYVYAPRFLNLICRLDYDKQDISHLSAIINFFAKKDKKINNLLKTTNLQNINDYSDFITNNIKLFTPLVKKECNQYKKYLQNNIKTKGNVGIVDTLTVNFSSQRLIENVLNHKCFGFYWTTKTILNRYHQHTTFLNSKLESMYKQTKNWNFMELLMTAPEFPIKQLKHDGTPVYDTNPSKAEQIRKKIYPDISSGAVDFAKDIKKVFDGIDIYLSGPTLVSWVNCFCDFPTNIDIKNMKIIKHAPDSAHHDYIPLFCADFKIHDFFLHPRKVKKIQQSCMWHSPIEKLMKPFVIKNRGIKYIQIMFFPLLKKNFFICALRFSDDHFYQITLGNPKG